MLQREMLEQVQTLVPIRTGATTLISYYVPAGSQLAKVNQHIANELSTAANIKSKTTRKDVQRALRSLKDNFAAIPPNGLAIFVSAESYI